MDFLVHFVNPATTLLQDEEFIRHPECSEKQLLFAFITLILI